MPFFEYNYKKYFSSLINNIYCNINTLYFLAVHLSKAEFNILFTTVHKGIHRPAFKIYQLTSQVIHYPSLMSHSSPAIRFQGHLLE